MPFSVHDNVDHPLSLYGATKKANELMAHSYAHLFALPTTGLRFFTVYGPWGRPDMAMWMFATAIIAGEPIKLFNNGNMQRDFTYVDDVVESVVRLVDRPPAGDPAYSGDAPDPGSSRAPWRVYNIGNNSPVEVLEVVRLLEEAIGLKAKREYLPMQPGDVPATYADVDDLMREVGFRPATPIAEGISRFVDWYPFLSQGSMTMTAPTLADLKVKLFTDGADKAQIVEMAKQPWIAGFTTNPSLLKKAGREGLRGLRARCRRGGAGPAHLVRGVLRRYSGDGGAGARHHHLGQERLCEAAGDQRRAASRCTTRCARCRAKASRST